MCLRPQANRVEEIRTEVKAAKSLGLPANFEIETDLPFPVKAAIRFSDQAQFHPRKFLLELAKTFVTRGGVIYEQTKVTDINPGKPHSLKTKNGDELRARSIVQASGEPFWEGEIFDGRMWIKMSYGLVVRLKPDSNYPKDMYITTDEPLRTIRSAPYGNGRVLLFGGESHEWDEKTDNPDAHYQNLIEDVHARFDVESVLYRWLAGDYMPYDLIPCIGPLPDHPSIYVVTGYRAWDLLGQCRQQVLSQGTCPASRSGGRNTLVWSD